MSISNVTLNLYAPDPKDPRAESDPQVKRLEAQIKDWETCPTTDPQTKKKILDPLISEVNSMKTAIDKTAPPATDTDPPKSKKVDGSSLDVLV